MKVIKPWTIGTVPIPEKPDNERQTITVFCKDVTFNHLPGEVDEDGKDYSFTVSQHFFSVDADFKDEGKTEVEWSVMGRSFLDYLIASNQKFVYMISEVPELTVEHLKYLGSEE